ncbi:isoamyl alcohol oxidase [Pyrenophora seminiperda CCB06]|uniref:Isoamyl alcohol oxidase n=1 Tax=Pyrenophora seminiperda CCB06 TaxID=1302712 RepID=A0A3M7MBA6_9PLEO|nr:isoamyl alcohol oxidase [Pyrenophora seminiperda CCB06]
MSWLRFRVALLPLFLSIVGAAPLSQQLELASLNQTCQGRLFAAAPLSRPCFAEIDGRPAALQQAQCSIVRANYTSAEYRTDHYNGFMHDYNEICPSSANAMTAQCLLDPTNPASMTTLNTSSCGQGSVSRHYVEISSANDVQAAFTFARRTGQTLSIKNSGHDYASRSSLKGSLALWTRKLQKIEYNANFTPEGCHQSRNNTFAAMTVGAGVNFNQAYTFADQHNVTFVGGSSPTVGASGGFGMTGGHGLLTSQFGLGIDRVLQYKVVTPDGVYRTANRCQNKDLYWALRGGGGGTFGVVMESTSKVEPRLNLIFSLIQMPPNVTDTTRFVEILMNHAPGWAREGWGGPNGLGYLAMVNPFISLAEAQKSMEPLSSYVSSVGGNVIIEQHTSFLSVYSQYVQPTANLDIPAASFATNRIVPSHFLETDSGKEKIQTILSKLNTAGFSPTIFQTTPAYYQSKNLYRAGETSATPAWRDSIWMITGNTQWAWNSTLTEKRETVQKIKAITSELEAFAPESGAYTGEADPWTRDWQEAWWGKANYAKLEGIKRKYDPRGLLSCWRCVGWKEGGGRFECMGGLDQ